MRTIPIFDKITWINAVAGIVLLCWQLIAGSIPMGWQVFYFVLMIGSAGIPHGALDHHVARASAAYAKKKFTIPGFLLRYVAVSFFYSYCWIKLPGISLIIFLLISAWHFGETDLHAAKNTWLWTLSRFLWGSLVLLILLLTHAEETTQLVLRITNQSANAITILEFFKQSGIFIAVSILLLCTISILIAHRQNHWQFKKGHIANLLIIIILTAYLPLLPAFALYFGGWHAIRSFEIIFTFLNKQNHEAAPTPVAMWKNAIPMTFLAAVGFVFMAFIWKGTGLNMDPLPFIFIFLSVITLPHLDVMDKLINSKESH
jgi:Brp/Blh family beta-carotene 15,15'-monooxygenase